MGKKLYVGNLDFGTTDADLTKMFEAHGSVVSAQIIMDRDTGRSKGFGFVEMGTDQEAQAAITAMNGQAVNGRSLTVNEGAAEGAGRRWWRRWWPGRLRRWWWRRGRRRWWPRRIWRQTILNPNDESLGRRVNPPALVISASAYPPAASPSTLRTTLPSEAGQPTYRPTTNRRRARRQSTPTAPPDRVTTKTKAAVWKTASQISPSPPRRCRPFDWHLRAKEIAQEAIDLVGFVHDCSMPPCSMMRSANRCAHPAQAHVHGRRLNPHVFRNLCHVVLQSVAQCQQQPIAFRQFADFRSQPLKSLGPFQLIQRRRLMAHDAVELLRGAVPLR